VDRLREERLAVSEAAAGIGCAVNQATSVSPLMSAGAFVVVSSLRGGWVRFYKGSENTGVGLKAVPRPVCQVLPLQLKPDPNDL